MSPRSDGPIIVDAVPRIFGAPRRYVQGPGALDRLADIAREDAARRPLVIADAFVRSLLEPRLRRLLEAGGVTPFFETFGGECTAAEIERLAAAARATRADLLVGVGGGKAIDATKGARLLHAASLVIVPTIASTDAPTSRVVVVYSEDHALAEIRRLPVNPDIVLVDTALLVAAPERFYVSGVGDALSKSFEVAQCVAAGGRNLYDGRPPLIASAIADACYAAVRTHAEGGLAAVRRGATDDAFEQTVEATILLSGLAFENGGLSIAHALTRGLSIVPGVADALHGEQVAFGLLVQLVLEQRPAAMLVDLRAFYGRLGLPRSLRELGLVGDAERAAEVIATDSWRRAPSVRHLSAPVDAERLTAAIRAVEGLAT